MKFTLLVGVLALLDLALAVPRKSIVLKPRQASTCSCPPDIYTTATSVFTTTLTSSATVSTNAGGTQVTASTQTNTVTIQRTSTVTAPNTVSTTLTVGPVTTYTTSVVTTVTVNSTISSTTVTTCIVSAYKAKRQASRSTTSVPTVTTVTTNPGGSGAPATCVCRLVSAYGLTTSTSTSPASACSCKPISTWGTTVMSTATATLTATTTISNYQTSTITAATTSTVYSDSSITTTITTTFTIASSQTTSTQRQTVTVTSTITPTFISCPTANLNCNNQGLRFGIYNNTNAQGANNTNTDSTYSSFLPSVFKTRTPFYQNVTYTLGGFNYPASQPVYISIYNSTRTFESDYIAINHVGYVFAQVSGTYVFSLSKSDDITLLWVGANAYSGYTRANANIVNTYGAGTSTYNVSMVAGNYYPVRIWFGNAQEAIVFQTTLTAPDGTVILTSNSKKSPYLVQYSCDGSAPAFPAFGSET